MDWLITSLLTCLKQEEVLSFTEEYYLDTSKSFSDSASPLCPLSQPLDCAHFNLSELLSQKLDKGSLWAVWSA